MPILPQLKLALRTQGFSIMPGHVTLVFERNSPLYRLQGYPSTEPNKIYAGKPWKIETFLKHIENFSKPIYLNIPYLDEVCRTEIMDGLQDLDLGIQKALNQAAKQPVLDPRVQVVEMEFA